MHCTVQYSSDIANSGSNFHIIFIVKEVGFQKKRDMIRSLQKNV